MLKKVSLILFCVILASCRSVPQVKDEGGVESYNTDITEISLSDSKGFKVGMLLPLTGADSKYGQGLKNASMMALNDINNPSLVLQYYDTKSTAAGARIAVENAINQQSDLIIGPLKSAEVQAISSETIYQGIPVMAFSTAQEVLQPTVYTLGLLVEEQVDRIMSYAAENGRKRFALLLPDNNTGGAVARAAVKSAEKNNVELTVIGFYPPGTSDFSDIAKQMTNYGHRHARVSQVKSQLQSAVSRGDIQAQKALKRLETSEGLGDPGFDALIIPESGSKLTAAIAMFAYYDTAYPQVQFLGTSMWEVSKLNNEATFYKSLYPAVKQQNASPFANQYYAAFGDRPSSLYTLAYDAVHIANQLAEKDKSLLNENITADEGFETLNGKIRFFNDGSNQHTLDIVEIRPKGNVVVDSGSRYFESLPRLLPPAIIDETYRLPKIYGKDSALAQILIYGRVLEQNEYSQSDLPALQDRNAANEQLKEVGVYIN